MEIKDGDWTLYSWDPELKRTVWSYYDGAKQHFRIDYQVDELVQQNQAERNDAPSNWAGDWHKVASIPHNVLYASGLDAAMVQRDNKFVKNWLNDSDNRAWRTKGGQI